jgi:DNA-3-methyladenine glycosylase I
MIAYHDTEWGVPLHDDRRLFECLTLEAAQAGLSWATVLRKRVTYRLAFADFDMEKVARFDADEIERLMQDPGIIRNRAKILATINNASRFMEVQRAFGSFDTYLWEFVGGAPIVNRHQTHAGLPATTAISDRLAKDLKRRGFKFVGSTVIYSHMQATGMVNDHLVSCFRHFEVGSDSRR